MIGGRIQPLDPEASLRALLSRRLPVATTSREVFALLASRGVFRVKHGEFDLSAHAVEVVKTTMFADGATLVFGAEGCVVTEASVFGGVFRRGAESGVVVVTQGDGQPSRFIGTNITNNLGEALIVDGTLLMVACFIDGQVRVGATGRLAAVGCKIDGGIVVDPGGTLSEAGNL